MIYKTCATCAGTGHPVTAVGSGLARDDSRPCPDCQGVGRVRDFEAEARAEQRQRREAEERRRKEEIRREKRRAREEEARQQVSQQQAAKPPKATRPRKSRSWSTGAAVVGFVLTFSCAVGIWELPREVGLVLAGVGAVVTGLYYREVLGIAAAGVVGWLLLSHVLSDSPSNGTGYSRPPTSTNVPEQREAPPRAEPSPAPSSSAIESTRPRLADWLVNTEEARTARRRVGIVYLAQDRVGLTQIEERSVFAPRAAKAAFDEVTDRYRRVRIDNECPTSWVDVAVHYEDLNGIWRTEGWWSIAPGPEGYAPTDIRTYKPFVYIFWMNYWRTTTSLPDTAFVEVPLRAEPFSIEGAVFLNDDGDRNGGARTYGRYERFMLSTLIPPNATASTPLDPRIILGCEESWNDMEDLARMMHARGLGD